MNAKKRLSQVAAEVAALYLHPSNTSYKEHLHNSLVSEFIERAVLYYAFISTTSLKTAECF